MSNGKKVDLTLLVPDYWLDIEKVKEFVQALEEDAEVTMQNIEEINSLWEVWKVEGGEDWIGAFLEKIGMEWGLSVEDVKKFIDCGIDFLKRKGSRVFVEKLLKQIGMTAVVENLEESTMIVSGGRVIGDSVIQDSQYYRDGSVLMTVSSSFSKFVDVVKDNFVPVGVYLWVSFVVGLVLVEENGSIDFMMGNGYENEVHKEEGKISDTVLGWDTTQESFENEYLLFKIKLYRGVVNGNVLILS